MKEIVPTVAAALALCSIPALAMPRSYTLPAPAAELRAPTDPAHQPGFEAAQNNCVSCHSADYITMQPPGKGAAFWDSEVVKMRKIYHAPIGESDGKVIAAYLAGAY